MPAVDRVARFTPGKQGEGKFSLIGFNGQQNLGEYTAGIELIVVRRNEEHLGDWVSNSADGFILVTPRRARQRALDFEFEVGPEVVDPMAFDNSGDYLLKIRDVNGTVQSFVVSLQDTPRASSSFSRQVARDRASPAPGAQANEPQANNQEAPVDHLKPHPEPVAPQPNSKMPLILKIVGAICALALIAGAVYFVLDMMNKGSKDPAADSAAQEQTEQAKDSSEATDATADTANAADAAASSAAPGSPCALTANAADDKTVISNCLSSNPKREDIYVLLHDAMKAERCEIVQRILRTKGRASDGGPFAHVYARYSDPGSQFTNKCIEKNANDSQYWTQRTKADKNFDQREADLLMERLSQK